MRRVNDLLAGARLAGDEHGGVRWPRRARPARSTSRHDRELADDAVEAARRQLAGEAFHRHLQPLGALARPAARARLRARAAGGRAPARRDRRSGLRDLAVRSVVARRLAVEEAETQPSHLAGQPDRHAQPADRMPVEMISRSRSVSGGTSRGTRAEDSNSCARRIDLGRSQRDRPRRLWSMSALPGDGDDADRRRTNVELGQRRQEIVREDRLIARESRSKIARMSSDSASVPEQDSSWSRRSRRRRPGPRCASARPPTRE